MSINDILAAATYLKNYIETNYVLPEYVTVGTVKVTIPQFLYLITQATEQIADGNKKNILLISVDDCAGDIGNEIYGNLNKTSYYDLAQRVSAFCVNHGAAPNYGTTELGQVKYSSLVYAFTRILAYYDSHGALPSTVYVNNFLSNPILTVTMMPSSTKTEGYKYIQYITSWLNYCPDCGHYGSLLVNPKGVYEGELTCHDCDADFCGVTGWDKYPADNQLIRKSDSIPVGQSNGTSVTLAGILNAAVNTKGFIEANGQLPNYITIDNDRYTCAQALYLFSQAIVNINNKNFSDIKVASASEPSRSCGTVIESTLNKTDYLDVCNRVAKFILNNELAPIYASSPVGQISYNELIDATSRILAYYKEHDNTLPLTVDIHNKGGSTTQTIAEKTASLIDGLTSDLAKATAIYNFVRDSIAYEFYYNTQKGADGTLAAGTGNCCDQAQLLVAMFRSAGLTTRFVHGYCYFRSGSYYGHVWTQVYLNGEWVVADPTSGSNSLGKIVNWDTSSYTLNGIYDVLPF